MTSTVTIAQIPLLERPTATLAPDVSVPTITNNQFLEGGHAGNFTETRFKALLIFR